jgi:hypothetical protein
VEGTWVFGFFRDGNNAQEPVMLGTLPGIPECFSDPSKGFSDPTGKYPVRINEPDTNRLAVNDPKKPHPILKQKQDTLEKEVPLAFDGSWDEPKSEYAAQYPFNHVQETESGHIMEYDDTPGKERIHQYHKSGTFTEVAPNGTTDEKIVGDKYEIVQQGSNTLVKGAVNFTTDKNAKIRINDSVETHVVNGDLHIRVDQGNVFLDVKGNMEVHVSGNYRMTVDGRIDMNGKTIHFNED